MIRLVDLALCALLLLTLVGLTLRRWDFVSAIDRVYIGAACALLGMLIWGFWEFYRAGAPVTVRLYIFGAVLLGIFVLLIIWPHTHRLKDRA